VVNLAAVLLFAFAFAKSNLRAEALLLFGDDVEVASSGADGLAARLFLRLPAIRGRRLARVAQRFEVFLSRHAHGARPVHRAVGDLVLSGLGTARAHHCAHAFGDPVELETGQALQLCEDVFEGRTLDRRGAEERGGDARFRHVLGDARHTRDVRLAPRLQSRLHLLRRGDSRHVGDDHVAVARVRAADLCDVSLAVDEVGVGDSCLVLQAPEALEGRGQRLV
jgi:hypothetical protein